MNNAPELIIFDCDGVLVDSETIFNQVLVEDLGTRGFEITLKESMAHFVGGTMEGVQNVVKERGIDLPSDWIELLYEKGLARLNDGVDVIAGVPQLLEQLTELGLPFCVASNGPMHKMHLTLGQNDLLTRFDNALFSAYEINSWKPEPDLFLHAASQFSIAAERCVVIEDSSTGTLAAKNARMPCLGYSPEGPSVALEANGAKCFSHMDDVIGLLGLN